MLDGTGRSTGGESLALRQVVIFAVGVRGQLVTHQRNADEIGDFFLRQQPQGLGRIPLGHQHQLAAHGQALQEQGDFAGHVEQRHCDERGGLNRRCLASLGEQLQNHHGLADVVHRPRYDAEMIRIRALGISGGARGVENRRKVRGADLS